MLSLASTRVRMLCRLRPQLRSISQYTVKRKGGITYADIYTKNDVIDNLKRVESKQGTPVHDPILLDLLQSCGPGLIYHTQKERHQLLDTVWKKLHNAELVQDPVYYNQLLQLFIADGYEISPADFLDAMEANNVTPDTTTLALILEVYCKAGQMDQARAVLDHIKSIDVAVDKETSISAFRSLSIGMALANDLDGVDSAVNSLKSSGLVPHYNYYNPVLAAFAQAGNLGAIHKLLDKMVAEGLHPVDSTFEAILDGLAHGDHVDSIPTFFDYLKQSYWEAEDLRKMAVLFASRGQFDASIKLIECLIDNGDLPYCTITTTTELVLNHIVRTCEKDTTKLGSMIDKVIDLGISPRDVFECLLFNNDLCEYYVDLVHVMWKRGEPIRHTYLYRAIALIVKEGHSANFHNLMELLRDTQLGVDEVTIRYLANFVEDRSPRSKNIDTIMTILKNYNLLDNPTTVQALYTLVTENWKIPHIFHPHYDTIPKASRQPEYLAMLLAQLVMYDHKLVQYVPKLLGHLYADISDVEYFCTQIQTFLLGVLTNCSLTTTMNTVKQLIKHGVTDCIPHYVFSSIALHIRKHNIHESEDLKEFISWMMSTGRWESQQASKIMQAQRVNDIKKAATLFSKLKKEGKADKFVYSYYLMALATRYKDFHKEIKRTLQECYSNGIQILPMAIDRLLHVTSLYYGDAIVADEILSNAGKYFNYKPGPTVISTLARAYAEQKNMSGIMKCNGILKETNCEHMMSLHEKLTNVYMLQGKPDDIMAMICDCESSRIKVTKKMVSDLIKTHGSNGDIAGAVKAYYDTYHLAAPRESVLTYVLEKCVTANDKINIGPVVNMLLHSGAEPSLINRTIVLTHLQAGDLEKARWIVRTERMNHLNTEECVKTATNWCKHNNIDGIVGLLILCHEQNWSMEHRGTDIKQLFFHYIIRSKPSNRSEILNAYNKVTEAGIPLQRELHKYVETKLMDQQTTAEATIN